MNKILLYLLIFVIYVVFSKVFNPDYTSIDYVKSLSQLNTIITEGPASAILIKVYEKGFIFKTHYLQFKVVYPFQESHYLTVQTRKKIANQNKNFIGLSVYRINSSQLTETIALPPGTLFIGNRQYGQWIKQDDTFYYWEFYRSFKHLPIELGWGEFRPDKNFHDTIQEARKNFSVYFGEKNEFGPNSILTKNLIKQAPLNQPFTSKWHQGLKRYFNFKFEVTSGTNI